MQEWSLGLLSLQLLAFQPVAPLSHREQRELMGLHWRQCLVRGSSLACHDTKYMGPGWTVLSTPTPRAGLGLRQERMCAG